MRTLELPREGNVIDASSIFAATEPTFHDLFLVRLKDKIPNLDTWAGEPLNFVYLLGPGYSLYEMPWFTISPRTSFGRRDVVIDYEFCIVEGFNTKRAVIKADGSIDVFTKTSHFNDGQSHTNFVPVQDSNQKRENLAVISRLLGQARSQDEAGFKKPTMAEYKTHFKSPSTPHLRLVV